MKISKERLKQLYGLNLTDEVIEYFKYLFNIDNIIEYFKYIFNIDNIAVDYAAYNGNGNTKIAEGFYCTKPVEKRGLYDLYIDNHIDIPEGISKDSPCYKQFMKEKEANK